MQQPRSSRALVVLTVLALAMLATPLHADVVERTTQAGGRNVRYKVVLPDGYEPARTYPGILVFGGGPQTMNVVDNVLNRNFRAEAEKRGYIVIAPAAPAGQLFFEDGARIFPDFLEIESVLINQSDVAAMGAGQTAITVTAAAIGNAFFDATGVRLREIPFTPERVKAALQRRQS